MWHRAARRRVPHLDFLAKVPDQFSKAEYTIVRSSRRSG